jgi:hypothetical protein
MKIARIFEDIGGYFICDDDDDILDARGYAHCTKAEAMRAAAEQGYTHARGSGTYRGNNLTKLPQGRQ